MKRTHVMAFLVVLLLMGPFAAAETSSGDFAALYESAKNLLGSREKILFVFGPSRLIIWKSRVPEELMLMSITGLRNNPENVLFSFLAYSTSVKGIFSTTIYQCSWRRGRQVIIYECGVGMKFPPGLRGMVSDEVIRDLETAIKTAETPYRGTILTEVVIFRRPYS